MSTLKVRLRDDLTAAMKARDELVKSTLRMTLTAVHNVEVAGTQARELDDAEVLQVITKEAKKRAESAEAFAAAGRDELAAQERAEGEILARYLPQQLGERRHPTLLGALVGRHVQVREMEDLDVARSGRQHRKGRLA